MKNEIRGLLNENAWDYENGFYWFSHPTRINKLLAHYELYKSITTIPGDVFEFGVYKAASLIRLATFRNCLENDFSRKIVGFDAFGKFPKDNVSSKIDLDFIDDFEKEAGDGLSKDQVKSILENKEFRNLSLIEGNVFDTLEVYLSQFPATRIALLHLDLDVKDATKYVLDNLYERVVPNGIIIFDDYNAAGGVSEVVDEFVFKYKVKLEKTSHYFVPSFIRKPL